MCSYYVRDLYMFFYLNFYIVFCGGFEKLRFRRDWNLFKVIWDMVGLEWEFGLILSSVWDFIVFFLVLSVVGRI